MHIFRHLLEIALAIPAANDEKYSLTIHQVAGKDTDVLARKFGNVRETQRFNVLYADQRWADDPSAHPKIKHPPPPHLKIPIYLNFRSNPSE